MAEVNVVVVAGQVAEVREELVPRLQVVVQPHHPTGVEHRQRGQVLLDTYMYTYICTCTSKDAKETLGTPPPLSHASSV